MAKALSDLTAGELKKRLERLETLNSKYVDEMIASGRGHERFSDFKDKTDKLSVDYYKAATELGDIFDEQKRRLRYSGTFKPIKKNPARRSTAISGRKGLSKTGYVNRPSQATEHKAPTKRLKTRRKKALEAPRGYFPNPRSGDPVAARELFLFGSNEGNLYRQRTEPIIANLAKKIASGKYDASKAPALWKYWADDAAKRYAKDYGGSFDVPTRKLAAAMAADYYADEIEETAKSVKVSRKKNPLIPGLVARTRKAGSPKIKVFTVQYASSKAGPWKTQGIFPTVGAARDYAKALAGKNPDVWFRVTV